MNVSQGLLIVLTCLPGKTQWVATILDRSSHDEEPLTENKLSVKD